MGQVLEFNMYEFNSGLVLASKSCLCNKKDVLKKGGVNSCLLVFYFVYFYICCLPPLRHQLQGQVHYWLIG